MNFEYSCTDCNYKTTNPQIEPCLSCRAVITRSNFKLSQDVNTEAGNPNSSTVEARGSLQES